MKTFTKFTSVALLAATTLVASSAANAAGLNSETCTSATYACQTWGYLGYDSYGYFAYSAPAPNGTIHNCTTYAAYMLDFVTSYDSRWKSLGDAKDWAKNAKAKGLQVGSIPHFGDIAQWNFGHVAFVEAVNKDVTGKVVSIKVTDDNYYRLVTTSKTIFVGATSNNIAFPDNFISFPKYSSGGGGKGPSILSTTPLSSQVESISTQ